MQLLLLLSLFLFSLAHASPSDILYIKKLVADEAHLLDAKGFAGLANIFTKNATYNDGTGAPNVYGIDSIEASLAGIVSPELLRQTAVSTESITLLPPLDEQGAAGTATAVLDTMIAAIGQGNLTGQALIFFVQFQDKYIKTEDFARYGGWRISSSFFVLIGEPVGNPVILPRSLRPTLAPP